MEYVIKGSLYAAICDDHKKPLANTKIRVYRLDAEKNEMAVLTTAQSKEIARVFEEKEIKARKGHLLAEGETDSQGAYLLTIDGDKKDYNGEPVAIVVYYDTVPDYGQGNTNLPKNFKPFEVLLDIIQPKWKESETILIAG